MINQIMIDSIILLQIDATIIAGAIILLTITSFVGKQDHVPIAIPLGRKRYAALTPHQVASGAIVAFGGSAFCILLSDSIPSAQELSNLFAVLGFAFLIISGIIIAAKEQFSQHSGQK